MFDRLEDEVCACFEGEALIIEPICDLTVNKEARESLVRKFKERNAPKITK